LIGFSCDAVFAFISAALQAPASLLLRPAAIRKLDGPPDPSLLILAVFVDVLLAQVSQFPSRHTTLKSPAPSPTRQNRQLLA
jgi:hypothetical protein